MECKGAKAQCKASPNEEVKQAPTTDAEGEEWQGVKVDIKARADTTEEHWRKGHGARREAVTRGHLEEAKKQAEALRKAGEAKRHAPGPTGATPDATRREGAGGLGT